MPYADRKKHRSAIRKASDKWHASPEGRAWVQNYNRNYRANPAKQSRIAASVESAFKRKYGITLAEKQRMVDAQANRCDICLRAFASNRDACLDHDHASGRVRSVLCAKCNLLLGLSGDDRRVLQRADAYLLRYGVT